MKRIIGLLILFLSLTCVFSYVLAEGSYTISYNTSTLTYGDSLTVSIKANNATGRFNISSSNTSVATVSPDSVWLENNSQSITIKSVGAGTSTITILPADVADSETGDDITSALGSKTINLTVKEKVVAPPKQEVTTPAKSSDATLKSLRLSVEGMSPTFNKNTTSYNLNVGTSVTSISVTASVNNSNARYYVTGNTNLKEGTNTIKVVVTAEAGNTKTYTITVTKAKDAKKANANLHSLIVSNATLNEEFTSEKLNYTLKEVPADVEALKISAYPEDTNALVKITGNGSLVSGENTVVIKVTAQDGITVKEYTLKFIKQEAQNVPNDEKEQDTNKPQDVIIYNENNIVEGSGMQSADVPNEENFFKNINEKITTETVLLIVYAVAIIELIQIIYLYVKLRSYKD